MKDLASGLKIELAIRFEFEKFLRAKAAFEKAGLEKAEIKKD